MKHLNISVALLSLLSASLYSFDFETEKNLFCSLGIQVNLNPNWISELNTMGALSQPRNQVRTMIYIDRPLFRAFPGLHAIDHTPLCQLPTPVEKLDKLSEHLHHAIYIKRDDLTGGYNTVCTKSDEKAGIYEYTNTVRYGGNKPRKLEFLFGQALAHGCDTFITFGCVGSNFARATAFYGHELNCEVHCMLAHQKNSTVVQQNLLSHLPAESNLHFNASRYARNTHATLLWLDLYHRDGKFPYIIPTGGSNEVGALGFVNAAFELKEQIDQGLMPEPARIYLPCGSMATTVGLAIGCKLAGLNSCIVAMIVEPEETPDEFKNGMISMTDRTIALLQSYSAEIPTLKFEDLNIEIRLDQAGPCYGVFTPEGTEAAALMQDLEHVALEGTYTAKALAGLVDDMKKINLAPEIPVLFWNTYCGIAPERSLDEYEKLPATFHHYFTDPVQ